MKLDIRLFKCQFVIALHSHFLCIWLNVSHNDLRTTMLKTFCCCRVLFASSVLNLAELIALRPDIAAIRKVLYFHENQLVYPVRKQQDRDFQYGYNQIISW